MLSVKHITENTLQQAGEKKQKQKTRQDKEGNEQIRGDCTPANLP